MRIGLDLSVIQTPHRMRGIGATAINFVNNLSAEQKNTHSFVIYLYPGNRDEALELLDLKGLDYEIRDIAPVRAFNLPFPGRLRIFNSMLNQVRSLAYYYRGNTRIRDLSEIDCFLQFDQMSPPPKHKRRMKIGVILYDVIPYVLEDDYLWSYKTARSHGHSRKGSLRKAILRFEYKFKLRAVTRRSHFLFAISEHTKEDFVRYIGTSRDKIMVTHLGITHSNKSTTQRYPGFTHYTETSWGYIPRPVDLQDKPFVLFIGGADPRRRLQDLAEAYNNLKGEGADLRLVLAGDTMRGPYAIPVERTQKYLASSSYAKDIAYLGFISDQQRDWLYGHALAFVYPSAYEGFGLPVLEAMQYGTPVVTYANSSITEVAGDAALYAHNGRTIRANIEQLLASKELREHYRSVGKKQAAHYDWHTTTDNIVSALAS